MTLNATSSLPPSPPLFTVSFVRIFGLFSNTPKPKQQGGRHVEAQRVIFEEGAR